MKTIPLLMIVVLLVSGCASLNFGEGGVVQRFNQSRNLAAATALLEKGDRPGAIGKLTAIVASPGVPGITDEALVRLALLTLRSPTEREGSSQALQLLRRLKKEYPTSPWTLQAAALTEVLAAADEMKRQNRHYRTVNQSLTGEINELKQSIDQLKRLEQELERKHR